LARISARAHRFTAILFLGATPLNQPAHGAQLLPTLLLGLLVGVGVDRRGADRR
jgi:hypothetical protein